MSEKFGFDKYKDYDFYHARLGRGAVVVAIKKNSESNRESGRGHSDLRVAQIFGSRDQDLSGTPQKLDPIQSIKEKDGLVELEINFSSRYSRASYSPMDAVIKRILPYSQVTFEIVKENNSA